MKNLTFDEHHKKWSEALFAPNSMFAKLEAERSGVKLIVEPYPCGCLTWKHEKRTVDCLGVAEKEHLRMLGERSNDR